MLEHGGGGATSTILRCGDNGFAGCRLRGLEFGVPAHQCAALDYAKPDRDQPICHGFIDTHDRTTLRCADAKAAVVRDQEPIVAWVDRDEIAAAVCGLRRRNGIRSATHR